MKYLVHLLLTQYYSVHDKYYFKLTVIDDEILLSCLKCFFIFIQEQNAIQGYEILKDHCSLKRNIRKY